MTEQGDNINENTFFSIRRESVDEDDEYFYFRANSAGLKKYAEELNKIAKEIEDNKSQTSIKLPKGSWIKGNISIDYVEIVEDIPTSKDILLEPEQVEHKNTLWTNIGCFSVIIFVLIAIIVGTITIIKWL